MLRLSVALAALWFLVDLPCWLGGVGCCAFFSQVTHVVCCYGKKAGWDGIDMYALSRDACRFAPNIHWENWEVSNGTEGGMTWLPPRAGCSPLCIPTSLFYTMYQNH